MKKICCTLLLLNFLVFLFAQNKKQSSLIKASSALELKKAVEQREKLSQSSLLKKYPVRNIGPTVMSGRIVDIEASQKDFKKYYVAFASGGVFKTLNNGLSFEPVFDGQARLTVGDIAMAPGNEKIIWVGTGENNSSRSSYAGYGVYKSEDEGASWQWMGLENTQHIGRILVHPSDENTVWVAAIGSLYSSNADRGVYKSRDGGKTWKKTLFINDSTGVIELIIHPKNPDLLWAAAWERSRTAWNFKENGPGSGLYMSEDGGETWKKIENGLPESKWMGRIGLDICLSQPNVLYLVVDNQQTFQKPKKEEQSREKLTVSDIEKMTADQFLAHSAAEIDTFLSVNAFPKKYNAALVKQEVKNKRYTPKDIAAYLKNANSDLFEAEVTGAEVYRSDDFGKSWKKVNSYALEGLFYTYGYYFGQVRVSPDNPELIYVLGVPCLRSKDGGKTYQSIAAFQRVHADHHALWIDPKDPNRILLGNDGGLYLSYDRGDRFQHINNIPAGQFYTVAVDMEKPYNVYGGLQDNGVYFGSSKSKPNEDKHWEAISGGDGMYVQVHPKNNKLIYTGFQFGNYWRIENGRSQKITPRHNIGEPALRFNWRTPLILSNHNPDIVFIAAQKVYRSMNRGEQWEAISPDLTKNRAQGNVPYSTISSLAESPLKFGMLYAGTDDGNIWVTKNGGANWDDISKGLPKDRWVSSIHPSGHDENTVFISLTGYRYDEINAYIFKSTDAGKTWVSVKGNLPEEQVNVIIQDPVQPSLLYAGTDQGAFVSWDKGEEWQLLGGGYPNVATYDMLVHPRDNELVLATHGRSIFVMDVKPLQKAASEISSKNIWVFTPESVKFSKNWGKQEIAYLPVPEPSVEIFCFAKNPSEGLKLEVTDSKGNLVHSFSLSQQTGFFAVKWNLKKQDGQYLTPGNYSLVFGNDSEKDKAELQIRP